VTRESLPNRITAWRIPPLWNARRSGNVLVEVTLAIGLTVFLGLLAMKGSLLAISNNQWTIMQTLTDAYLTRETAVSVRAPMADLTAVGSPWPEQDVEAATVQDPVEIGRLPGGQPVTARLTRFRVNATQAGEADTGIVTWRLHSVLDYSVGGQRYVKSRATLRAQ
jgi:hypothetical protein